MTSIRNAWLSLIGLLPLTGYTQQVSLFSQGLELYTPVNPAALDPYILANPHYNRYLQVGLNWRNPFHFEKTAPGDKGPETRFANLDYTFVANNNMAVLFGAHFYEFDTDPIFQERFHGRFALAKKINAQDGWLSAGFSAGLAQYRVATDKLIPLFPDDPVLLAANARDNVHQLSLAAGAWFFQPVDLSKADALGDRDKVFAGLSMPQIGLRDGRRDNFGLHQISHYYAMVGATREIRLNYFLEPMFLLKKVAYVPWHWEFSLRLQYDFNFQNKPREYWMVGVGMSGSGQLQVEGGIESHWPVPVFLRASYGLSTQSSQTILSNILEFSILANLWKGEY